MAFAFKELSKRIHPWKSRSQFVQSLCENIVYNKDGLIAINKFYGIPVYKVKGDKMIPTVITPFNGNFSLSIEESLPLLKNELEVKQLKIIKSTEKYSSGILLLSSSDKVTEKVTKAFIRGKSENIPHLIYWALTVGCPTTETVREKVGIKLSTINDIKQPVILKEISANQIKKKVVKPVIVDCSLLESNKELSCSLVKLAVSSVKSHFLKVYMTTRGSYVLGDVFFGRRVGTVFGKSVETSTTYGAKSLPDDICQKLRLPRGTSNEAIPVMLHLNSIFLRGYDSGKDLVVAAPPPPHFLWMCEKLEIFPECLKYLECK
ncbi:mitochondrial mRNA pseudouridine synthase RPUSD3-like isoform X1 [Centruroides vittatus]|uniref:mitochondrial mRNA pseudouridine synthase RPUSD3-like isoform X1 n=2 Tax=Centruroides vittatus TaxID=120091 RepID=UPI00350EDC6E